MIIRFIKVAVYDKSDQLVTFKHLNHNGVGTPSIHTIGKYDLKSRETIDLFKTRGGKITAEKENLRLLATLPFEMEVVREGDVGDISLLDNDKLLITQAFNGMVEEIVKLTKPKESAFA